MQISYVASSRQGDLIRTVPDEYGKIFECVQESDRNILPPLPHPSSTGRLQRTRSLPPSRLCRRIKLNAWNETAVPRTLMTRTLIILTGALILVPGVAPAEVPSESLSAAQCGTLKNSYGPFDYRTSKTQLEVVENFHFTPDVEHLRRGQSSYVGSDIDYTLRASPNHHRALVALTNLALRTNTTKAAGTGYTVDCYFERALRFANDDGLVRIIYGVYLYRTGKKRDALRVLEDARRFEDDNPNLHYNLGLIYFDLHDIPRALESAQTAYRLGAQLPGLKNKLKAAGVWDPGAIERKPPAETGKPD